MNNITYNITYIEFNSIADALRIKSEMGEFGSYETYCSYLTQFYETEEGKPFHIIPILRSIYDSLDININNKIH
jgi:hypothetical protein